MIPPVVTVVGYSNSGKTTVASFLVSALTESGYRVAAVKHCPHGHDINRANSDSDRLHSAGAVTSVASSPGMITAVVQSDGDTPLESIVSQIGWNVDIVIAEGYKTCSFPKIVVAGRDGAIPDVENAIAIVSNAPAEWDLPTYATDQLGTLARQLIRDFLDAKRNGRLVTLIVDGEAVPLKQYPQDALAGIIKGFVSSLRGVPSEPGEIQVIVKLH